METGSRPLRQEGWEQRRGEVSSHALLILPEGFARQWLGHMETLRNSLKVMGKKLYGIKSCSSFSHHYLRVDPQTARDI